MVFMLDKDDGSLLVLESADQAPLHCKAVDVEDGYWLFFAADGSPLEAWFERDAPAGEAPPGPFALERAMSGRWLQERLDQVKSVRGCGIGNIEALIELWKPVPGARGSAGRKPRT